MTENASQSRGEVPLDTLHISTNATPFALFTFAPTSEYDALNAMAFRIKAHVIAQDVTGSAPDDAADWEIDALFKQTTTPNTIAQVGATSTLHRNSAGAATWDCVFNVVAGAVVEIDGTGEAATDIVWHLTYEIHAIYTDGY